MIKAILILGLAAIASAQVLRISPPVIGSNTAGQQQVIQLSGGGGLGSGAQTYKRAPVQPQYQPAQYQQPRQVVAVVGQPQVVNYQPAQFPQPRPVGVAQPYQASAQPRPVVVAQPYQAPVQSFQAQPQSQPAYSASRYSEQEENSAPTPYGFSFDSEDEYGTKIGRTESADQQGVVTGSYTLSDANGIARIVNYVADAQGFRATVQTNEPGTLTSNPANVQIQSSYAGAPAAAAPAAAPARR